MLELCTWPRILGARGLGLGTEYDGTQYGSSQLRTPYGCLTNTTPPGTPA